MTRGTAERFLAETQRVVDRRLRGVLRTRKSDPASVQEAMKYSVFGGGKRFRPALCVAANRAVGGRNGGAALDAACALELIHAYSLIHDDLPCMDDGQLRRGKPTVHRVYGSGTAVLTGDALHALAFELLSGTGDAAVVGEVARAIGVRGMIGGQVADLEAEGRRVGAREVRYIHTHKTGALIEASVRCGAIVGGADGVELRALTAYARAAGLAFQIADDVLDATADTASLGKKAGADSEASKATYPAVFGVERSRVEAGRLASRAKRALVPMGRRGDVLAALADFVVDRGN